MRRMTSVTSQVMAAAVGCRQMFTCPQCNKPMIWGSDSDDFDADGVSYISSYFSCNDCGTFIDYMAPMGDEGDAS